MTKKFTFEKECVIKSLVDLGMNYREIQKIIPISLGSIPNIIKRFESDREFIEYYKDNRADILAHIQGKYVSIQKLILDSIKATDIKKANLDQKMKTLNILGQDSDRKFSQERLERGESTENVAVLYKHIQEMKKRDKQIPNDGSGEDRTATQG